MRKNSRLIFDDERGRVIVIGLDGATWDIIKPLINKGDLPTFKRLMKEGIYGVLESTPVPISPASWTTITTGVNPAKHGIFDFSVRRDDSYNIRPVSPKDIKCPRIWNILQKYGKKCYIINVSLTYPPEKINGAMISGFPCVEEKNISYPSDFINELKKNIDPDIHFQPRASPHEEDIFFDEVFKVTEYTKDAIIYILKKKNFDFLMCVFIGPDAVCHAFFKYFDKNHPLYKENEKFARAIPDMYKKLDDALKLIIDNLKENDKLFIVSDHGHAPVYYAVALNKWLMKHGYLKLKRKLSTLFKFLLFNFGLTYENLFNLVKKLGLSRMAQREAYKEQSVIQKIMNLIMIGWNDVDWNRTIAYSQGNFGQIFINLSGREPHGIVPPTEYDHLVDKIISELRHFKHNNEVVFDIILRGRNVFNGPFIEKAPDIICLHSKSKYMVSRFFEFGSKKIVTVHPVWSGAHDRYGVFIYWSNKKDYIPSEIKNVKVEDVTPTILKLFNIPIPNYVDGKIVEEIICGGGP